MTDEQAKAVQEVAKTTGQGLDIVKQVGSFIGRIGGNAFMTMGGIFNDTVQFWRYQNLVRIADKCEAIQQKRESQGITTPIPPRVLIPLLEYASKEDDETLQDLWAALIVNGMDASKGLELDKRFVEILSTLESLDAHIILMLGRAGEAYGARLPKLSSGQIAQSLGVKEEDVLISLDNLQRTGCVKERIEEPSYTPIDHPVFPPMPAPIFITKTWYQMTYLGRALLDACNVDKSAKL